MIITSSGEPKLIIGRTWNRPLFWLVGTEKLGCCYTFWFSWLTTWHHVNWNHSPSRSPSLKPCLEFWESESKCRLDRETGSSLLYACGLHLDLIVRTSNEGERKGIVGRYLRLYICEETGQPFFLGLAIS